MNRKLPGLRRVALGWEVDPYPDRRVRVMSVRDGCKLRVVTCASWTQAALKPLHDVVYDHLSRQDWLLRGDATKKEFSSFTAKDGEVFVSGDYESATDSISIVLYRRLLTTLSATSRVVPPSVWKLARDRSRSILEFRRKDGELVSAEQARGQLMGNFLSFPMLCLSNYLTFLWSVRRRVPVKINGDDIVFRCTREEASAWRKGVAVSGLTLSEGKTLEDTEFFSLNSTMFRGCKKGVRAVPFVRSKCLFHCPETPSAVVGQFRSLCPGLNGVQRRAVQVSFLRSWNRVVWVSQRSLIRDFGLRIPVCVLRQTRLWAREVFYLGEAASPLPTTLSTGMSVRPLCGLRSLARSELVGRVGVGRARTYTAGGLMRILAQGPLQKVVWRQDLQSGTTRYYSSRPKPWWGRWMRLCAKVGIPRNPEPPPREERFLLPVGDWPERAGLGLRPVDCVDLGW
jgi:hypothetical protein